MVDRTTVIFACTFVALACLAAEAVPMVKFISCRRLALQGRFDQCAKVWFGEDSSRDHIVLNYLKGRRNNMKGKLLRDGGRVSVTVHDGVANFMISKGEKLYIFTHNNKTGETKDSDMSGMGDVVAMSPEPSNQPSIARNVARMSLPAHGFKMRIVALYDSAFSSRFGDGAEETIDGVFVHVETFFMHSSLGTKITPDVISTRVVPETWTATSPNLRAFSRYVGAVDLPDADAYVLLTYDNNAAGVIGIAWLRSTCGSKQLRTGIIEYRFNDVVTAMIVVHEIGHNLGMNHDFNPSRRDRFASDGTPCTRQGGYMDYISNPSRWTKCSAADFDAYFQANRPFCLRLNSATGPTTPTARPTTILTTRPGPRTTEPASTSPTPTTRGPRPPKPAPTSPRPTTPKPPKKCVNKGNNLTCFVGRVQGLCKYGYFKRHCKLSCLVNIRKNNDCQRWARYCSPKRGYSKFMRRYCAKTCIAC